MYFKTILTSLIHLLHNRVDPEPRQSVGTLSQQDLRRIVAEMVG